MGSGMSGMGAFPPMVPPVKPMAPSVWSTLALQEWQTWKTVLMLAVLLFVLTSQPAQTFVSGYLSDSWPLRAHLPTLLLGFFGGLVILMLFRFGLVH